MPCSLPSLRRLAGRCVRGALSRFGYQLVPLPTNGTAPRFVADADELAELERDLRDFAAHHPGHGPWSDPAAARTYLHHARLCFFGEVLAACARHHVPLDGRDVADVGSGTGYLLRRIAATSSPRSLVGYDTYADITALARHLCPSARFVEQDALAGELAPADVVFATEVLEHLWQPADALQRLCAAVRPGGHVVLTVPDGRTDTFPALEPLPNGCGHWGHIHFWSPESWRLFVTQAGGGREVAFGQLATGQNYAILSA